MGKYGHMGNMVQDKLFCQNENHNRSYINVYTNNLYCLYLPYLYFGSLDDARRGGAVATLGAMGIMHSSRQWVAQGQAAQWVRQGQAAQGVCQRQTAKACPHGAWWAECW